MAHIVLDIGTMPLVENILGAHYKIEAAGDVNTVVNRICAEYTVHHGKSYAVLNELVGALECSKLELYNEITRLYRI